MAKVDMEAVRRAVRDAQIAKIQATMSADELAQVSFNTTGPYLSYSAPPELAQKIAQLVASAPKKPSQ